MPYSCSEYALIFKAMSDETRLNVLAQLSSGQELCACDILDTLSISQPTLSYHMKLLCDSGLVKVRKDGSWMKYTLCKGRVNEVSEYLQSIGGAK